MRLFDRVCQAGAYITHQRAAAGLQHSAVHKLRASVGHGCTSLLAVTFGGHCRAVPGRPSHLQWIAHCLCLLKISGQKTELLPATHGFVVGQRAFAVTCVALFAASCSSALPALLLLQGPCLTAQRPCHFTTWSCQTQTWSTTTHTTMQPATIRPSLCWSAETCTPELLHMHIGHVTLG